MPLLLWVLIGTGKIGYHDKTFTDKWFTTNGSRRMVGVRVRFRLKINGNDISLFINLYVF